MNPWCLVAGPCLLLSLLSWPDVEMSARLVLPKSPWIDRPGRSSPSWGLSKGQKMVCIVQIELFWSIDSVFLLVCSLVLRQIQLGFVGLFSRLLRQNFP